MKIREIKKNDPEAKMLVFVQWETLKSKIVLAFKEFGMNSVSLEGGQSRRANIIKNFEQPCDTSIGEAMEK